MGADFIEKAGRSFRKSWDRGRVERATADLFTRAPECSNPTGMAEVRTGVVLKNGEQLVVQLSEAGLVARRGIVEVARFVNPPIAVLQVVEQGCGIGRGEVQAYHTQSRVAEISVC
jgi:hypothetical protein